MKKIIELRKEVTGFDEKAVVDNNMNVLKTKELLLRYCSEYQGQNQNEHFLANYLGQKIWNCEEDELDLEDAEFNFLKQEVEKQPKYISLAMVNVYKALGVKSPYEKS